MTLRVHGNTQDLDERFMSKVAINKRGCWIWYVLKSKRHCRECHRVKERMRQRRKRMGG